MPIPLVERSESYIARRIRRKVGSLDGVADCAQVTIGFTRKKPSIHLEVKLVGNPSYEETHRFCSAIEREVRHLVPNSHVDIYSQSGETEGAEAIWKLVKVKGEEEPGSRGVQNIHLREMGGGLGVDLLIIGGARTSEIRQSQTGAHLERNLKEALPKNLEVIMHSESVSELVSSEMSGSGTEAGLLIEHVAGRFPDLRLLGPPAVRRLGDQIRVEVRVASAEKSGTEGALRAVSDLKGAIKNAYPEITRISIVEEPEVHKGGG